MRNKLTLTCSVLAIAFGACQEPSVSESPVDIQDRKLTIKVPDQIKEYRSTASGRVDVDVKGMLNATIFADANVKVAEVHMFKNFDPSTSVETLDRQFESTLPYRWVPGDTDRNWNGDGDLNDIDWVSFSPFAVANGSINAEPVYRDMYDLWETEGNCKNVNIDESVYDFSMGNPSLILDFGLPAGNPYADISIVGFLPPEIFEIVLGSENVLGVAFSFIFVDDNGDPVSTTRGKQDKAYTEVWFNDGFTWAMGTGPGVIDIESVVLHEFGHTLNLGHFGILQLFQFKNGENRLVYRPVNTMNAYYIGEPRNFLGQNDKGNFCEAWGSWPWN